MTPRLKEIYRLAKQDKDFCADMEATEGNFVPGFFADELLKICFATMYSGYLLKKLGVARYNLLVASL
jgi:hypothetical protein